MESDYSLFTEEKENNQKNEEYVWENLQISLNKNKFIILCLLFFGLIILYNYVLYNKDNSDMIQSYENKENVYFISKFNKTKKLQKLIGII